MAHSTEEISLEGKVSQFDHLIHVLRKSHTFASCRLLQELLNKHIQSSKGLSSFPELQNFWSGSKTCFLLSDCDHFPTAVAAV